MYYYYSLEYSAGKQRSCSVRVSIESVHPSSDPVNYISQEKKALPDLVERIFKINGILKVYLNKQEICIVKSKTVEWNNILPDFLKILKEEYCEGHELALVSKRTIQLSRK